jgi:hypothetical protein
MPLSRNERDRDMFGDGIRGDGAASEASRARPSR